MSFEDLKENTETSSGNNPFSQPSGYEQNSYSQQDYSSQPYGQQNYNSQPYGQNLSGQYGTQQSSFVDPYANNEQSSFVDPYANNGQSSFVDPYTNNGQSSFVDPYANNGQSSFVDPYANNGQSSFVDPYANQQSSFNQPNSYEQSAYNQQNYSQQYQQPDYNQQSDYQQYQQSDYNQQSDYQQYQQSDYPQNEHQQSAYTQQDKPQQAESKQYANSTSEYTPGSYSQQNKYNLYGRNNHSQNTDQKTYMQKTYGHGVDSNSTTNEQANDIYNNLLAQAVGKKNTTPRAYPDGDRLTNFRDYYDLFASHETKKWFNRLVVVCYLISLGMFIIGFFDSSSFLDFAIYAIFTTLLLVTKKWGFSLALTIYGGLATLLNIILLIMILALGMGSFSLSTVRGIVNALAVVVLAINVTVNLMKLNKGFKEHQASFVGN